MSQVRIGVIGAGLIGRKHIEVLRSGHPEYTLAAVADPSPVAKAEAKQLGYVCYDSVEEMIDKVNPDGAVVSVPNQLHVEAGLACIQHGVPIVIEKPVADTIPEALTLVEAAEAAGVATLTGHHRRHNPIMRRAAEVIRAGTIGRIVAATSIWMAHKPAGYHDVQWRREPGGGPVLLNAIHDVDCLRMLCGDVETVQAADSRAIRGYAVEDTAAAILRFKSGALGTLLLSDAVSSPWAWETTSGENPAFPVTGQDSIFIGGTQGSLAVPSLDVRWHNPGSESWSEPLSQRREHIVPADPYFEQMRNFAAVIRGAEQPVLSGRDGMLTLATTLAITQSAETGQVVRIDEMLAKTAST
ncbi:MAG: Gfo/Idh/MocA family oxidoreductase [Pseudomonadota bacterium]